MSDFNLNNPVIERVNGRAYRPKVRRGAGGRFQRIPPEQRAAATRRVVDDAAARVADKIDQPAADHFRTMSGDWRVGNQGGRWTLDMDAMRSLPRSEWGDFIADQLPIDYDGATFGDSWITLDSAAD